MKKEIIETDDLKFIRGFAKVKIAQACRIFGCDQSNLMKGKCSAEMERNVRNYLEIQLAYVRINTADINMEDVVCEEK